ncbi:hypothetical protein CZ771_10935 [Actinomycetales bacterium JB111]|nr:hypothetical protein CZ771_10935 [Actinomycetales bacterium JB111]
MGVSGVLAAACLGGCTNERWADLPSVSMSDPVAVLMESYSAGVAAPSDDQSATRDGELHGSGGSDGSDAPGAPDMPGGSDAPDASDVPGDPGPGSFADVPLVGTVDEVTLAELRLASEDGGLDDDQSALAAALVAAGFDGLGDFAASMSTESGCVVVLTYDTSTEDGSGSGPASTAWARAAENRGILVLAALPWVDVIAADDADPTTGVVVVDRDEADGVVGGSVASGSLSVDDVRELAALLDERSTD